MARPRDRLLPWALRRGGCGAPPPRLEARRLPALNAKVSGPRRLGFRFNLKALSRREVSQRATTQQLDCSKTEESET